MNFDPTRLRVLVVAFFFSGLFVLALGVGLFLFRGYQDSDDIQIIAGGESIISTKSTGSTTRSASSGQAGIVEGELININTATERELDTLPGVGSVTAAKIIASRPYSVPEDLLNKKVVGKSTYEKIKHLISY